MYFILMYIRELPGEESMLALSLVSKERKSCDKNASKFDEYFILLFLNICKTYIFFLLQRKISILEKKNLLKLCTSSGNIDLIARFYAKFNQDHLAA